MKRSRRAGRSVGINAQASALARQVQAHSDEQIVALVRQAGGGFTGADLVDRIVANEDRPRLEVISWLEPSERVDEIIVTKWIQDRA